MGKRRRGDRQDLPVIFRIGAGKERVMRIRKFFARLLAVAIILSAAAGIIAMTINNHVVNKEKENIVYAINEDKETLLSSEIDNLKDFDADCILVLGAGIKDDETPTPMLKDRLDTGIMLYESGAAEKVLLTGDNGSVGHNEIHVMLNYLIDAGVPEEDIFCDHAGFSTYDSMYRAKSIFEAEKIIVVTQTYHQYRALYIGEKLGLSVIGVASDQMEYSGQPLREIREVFARVKDFFKTMIRAQSELGGEAIPIRGNGIATHGE